MSRPIGVVALIFLLALQAGCSTTGEPPATGVAEETREIFVGTWKGEYVDGEGHKVRSWVQTRSTDGTYVIRFVHYTEQGILHTMGKGKWWLEGGRFYEIAPETMEAPDVYDFEIISRDEIRFDSVTTSYSFTDQRTEAADIPQFM